MTTHHLVVQASDIETGDLKTLRALAGAESIEKIVGDFSHQAFRLTKASISSMEAVRAHCQHSQLDFAFVPQDAALSQFGLIAMDMDSTLISIECIDEIADFVGRKEEVSRITEAAMQGKIDWPASLQERVSALAGIPESALLRVYEDRLRLSPGAGALLSAARRANIKLLLVSGGFTFFTERLKTRLGIDFAYSNTLEIAEGHLTGRVIGPLCDAAAKAEHLLATARHLGLAKDQLLAIGDGANDLMMMAAAGTSIAYQAKPVVRAQASYSLSHVGLDGLLALFPTADAR